MFVSSTFLFLFLPLFVCSLFFLWSSHTSLIMSVCGGKISYSSLRGQLFKQHPRLMLFSGKANYVFVVLWLNIVINTYGFYVAWRLLKLQRSGIFRFGCFSVAP